MTDILSQLDPQYASDQIDLQRRMALAQALREQSMSSMGPTQVINGVAIRQSPLEGFAKIGQALAASHLDAKNNAARSSAAQKHMEFLARMLGGGESSPQVGAAATDAGALANGTYNANTPPDVQGYQQAQASQPQTNPFGMNNLVRAGLIEQLGGQGMGNANASQYTMPQDVRKMDLLGQNRNVMGQLATQKAVNEAQDIPTAERARLAYEGIPVPPSPTIGGVQPIQNRSPVINNPQSNDLSKLTPKARDALVAQRVAEQPKDTTSLEDMIAKTDVTTDQAKAIMNHPGLSSATGMMSFRGSIPGTEAFNAAKLVDTLKNEVMLSQLQAFRAASANGSSGFGQLSNAEGETLRNAITNLDRAQTTDQFKSALKNVIDTNEAIKERMKKGFNRLYGEQPDIRSYHTNPLSGTSNVIDFGSLK